jgi:hypothetical protein
MQTSRSSTFVILAHSPAACADGAATETDMRNTAEARALQPRPLSCICVTPFKHPVATTTARRS